MGDVEITDAELTNLQNQSVAVLAASAPRDALPREAAALLVAVPALCDEVRFLQGLLREVAATFDSVLPVGPPVRDDIVRYLQDSEAPEG